MYTRLITVIIPRATAVGRVEVFASYFSGFFFGDKNWRYCPSFLPMFIVSILQRTNDKLNDFLNALCHLLVNYCTPSILILYF